MQATGAATQESAAELANELGALMKFLLTATGRGFFAELERLELSVSQVKTLQFMSDAGAAVPLKAVSEQLGLSLPGVSRSVDALVKRGFVKRDEEPTDRRSKRLELTAKGRRTFEGLMELRIAGLREWVERLDADEREALLAGVRAVERHTG